MPNIKSAIKRVSVIDKKTLQNNMVKSAYKTAVKNFEAAVEAGNKKEAEELYRIAVRKVDQAATKGVIKDNTASRKKSCCLYFQMVGIYMYPTTDRTYLHRLNLTALFCQ